MWCTGCNFLLKLNYMMSAMWVYLRFKRELSVEPPVLLPIKNGRACAQPEAVTRGHLARGQQELLVQWRGQPAAEATWMDHQEFQRLYPDFQLEDELLAKGGGERCHGRSFIMRGDDA
jgi:hypothetical protein